MLNLGNKFRRFREVPTQRREEVTRELIINSIPGVDFFILVVLSSCIATLGLITNSSAVIIGAMLVAPLMSPIISLGLASITGDGDVLRSSFAALIRGALLAVLLSGILTLTNTYLPFVSLQEVPYEVLSRTRPTPIDLFIAIAGGMAAAYCISQPQLSAALPGVAIATALLPPLCTVGVGIALARWDIALGASLLFITNAIAIAFASALVLFLVGFGPSPRMPERQLPRNLVLSALLTLALLVPLSYLSVQFFQRASLDRKVSSIVADEIAKMDNTELIELSNEISEDQTINLDITIRTSKKLTYEQVVALQEAIVNQLNKPVSLVVNQMLAEQLDPLIPPTMTPTATMTYTFTLGPSPTNTHTPLTTPSATPTLTYSAAPSFTPSQTPTPFSARIVINYLPALQLYQSPGGPVIAALRQGQEVNVYNKEEVVNGIVWSRVMDVEGRIGWIPQLYLQTIEPLPTVTNDLIDHTAVRTANTP